MKKKIKYFHQLTKAEFHKLVKEKMTYRELAKRYPQPYWCNYPGATEGVMGCWSLTNFDIRNKEDCKNCEYIMPEVVIDKDKLEEVLWGCYIPVEDKDDTIKDIIEAIAEDSNNIIKRGDG